MPEYILVRMYNDGFGDCFLIEFPREAGAPFRILVNCGAHTSGYPRDRWRPDDTVRHRDALLLFPADAQWGTWHAALQDPRSRDLLAKTTFYKVSHHGSHNGTPVEFVERILRQDQRMWGTAVSVRPISFWPDIPRATLLEKLETRSDRVVRSDMPGRSSSGIAVMRGSMVVDFRVPF